MACGRCQSIFNTERNLPVAIFPCGHTFCQECVKALISSDLCPECKSVIKESTPNLCIIPQNPSMFEHDCKNCGKNAFCFCENCKISLCQGINCFITLFYFRV